MRPGAKKWEMSRRSTSADCAGSTSNLASRTTNMPGSIGAIFRRPSIGPTPKCICKAPSTATGRSRRCATSGGKRWAASLNPQPCDADVPPAEWDEDVSVADDGQRPATIDETFAEVHRAGDLPNDEAEAAPFDSDEPRMSNGAAPASDEPAAPPVRPFESLPPLPSDINEGFELMKLAILNHKVSGWRDIARDDILAVLDSLRQLALAPAE